MAVTPDDLRLLIGSFCRSTDEMIQFADSFERLAAHSNLQSHPEAMDIAYICAFRKLLGENLARWHVVRQQLKSSVIETSMFCEILEAGDVVLIPERQWNRMRAAQARRLTLIQAGAAIPLAVMFLAGCFLGWLFS